MKKLILALVSISAFATGEFVWQENGIPVRQGVHIEWQRTGDSGNEGEMIFAWSDTRTGDRDIYIQKVDTEGNQLWGETGTRATYADGRQEDPVLVSDGMGGAFLAWIDYRDDEYGDVYGQHIDSEGNLSWDPAGVPVAVNNGSQQSANMARGAAGFAYVIWNDASVSQSGDIFGTVFSVDGPLEDPEVNGFPLVSAIGIQTNHSIENSGSEAVVVWRDLRDVNDADIYGQRLDVNFTGLWGENGIVVCDDPADQVYPKVAPANGNNVAVSWLDYRNNIKADIFAQLLDEDGNELWTADGHPITNLAAEQRASRVKSNGVDKVYFVWEDFRNDPAETDQDIYVHCLDLDGNPVWAENGVAVTNYTLKQLQPRLTVGDDDGLFVTWLDERGGGFPNSDIYIQYVGTDGSMGFAENGLALTDGFTDQTGGLVRPDGSGGALVLWSNASSASIELMGQHVTSAGSQSWDADGLGFFFGLDGDAVNPQALTWGDDAALVAWEDNRFADVGSVAMAQVMDGTGGIQYALDGVALSENPDQVDPMIVPDYQGGAFISYWNSTTVPGEENAFAQHVNAEFVPDWAPEGIQVHAGSLPQFTPLIVSNPEGELYYFWTEYLLFAGNFIHLQKYDTEGNTLFDEVLPLVTAADSDVYSTQAHLIEGGDIILLWENETTEGNWVQVSRISSEGEVVWSEPVSESTAIQSWAVSAYDAATATVSIAWEDQRNIAESGVDLFAVDFDLDGNRGEEHLLTNDFGDQTSVKLSYADDGSSVLYAAWQSFDGFQYDVFVKNVTEWTETEQITVMDADNKSPALRAVTADRYLLAWEDSRNGVHSDIYFYDNDPSSGGHADEGVPLCLTVLNQSLPQIVPFGDSSPSGINYLIAWEDMRASGKTELRNIYVQAYRDEVSVNPITVPDEFKLGAAYPNPFNGSVKIEYELGQLLDARMTVFDIRGRLILEEVLEPQGAGSFNWNGLDMNGHSVDSGVYLISLSSGELTSSQKVMLIK